MMFVFYPHQTTYQSNIGVQLRKATQDPSTLELFVKSMDQTPDELVKG